MVLTGTRAYDGTTNADHPILSASNFVGGDTVNVAAGVGGLSGSAVGLQSLTSAGTLALSNNAAGNYTLAGASGSVTITQATSTVSVDSQEIPPASGSMMVWVVGALVRPFQIHPSFDNLDPRVRSNLHSLFSVAAMLPAGLLFGGLPRAVYAATPARPNILFILADDLGYMDIGANNPGTFYETPNIDSLARGGMRFTSGYAAAPVCSPSRAALLTGKYPPRTGITDFIGARQPEKWTRDTQLLPAAYSEKLALEERTFAEVLKDAGYHTFFAGKWHLGPEGFWPEQQGFEVNAGGCALGHPKSYFSPYSNPKLADGPDGESLPHRLGQETSRFIEANRTNSFLAYLSFYSVHIPLMASDELIRKYEAKAKRLKPAGPVWGKEGRQKVRLTQGMPVYAGMIEAMDLAIGDVLATLDRLGLASNTIVVFTSDNGGLSTAEGQPTSNLPLRAGKGWLYEGGIREPWIVRAPGVTKPGSVCDAPVVQTDFFPTLLVLAGLPPSPTAKDGVNLTPLLRGEPLERGPIFWHYPHYSNQGGSPGGAVRRGDWKLIEWYEVGRLELFNLRNDIGETNNLAAANSDKARQLHDELQQWRKEVGATMPAPNPNFGRSSALKSKGDAAKPVEE